MPIVWKENIKPAEGICRATSTGIVQWEDSMLTKTLKMLIVTGKRALKASYGLSVVTETITQMNYGKLEFPSLGVLGFTRAPLQQIYIGCDDNLRVHLENNASQSNGGVEGFVGRYLNSSLKEMSSRNPRGMVESFGAKTLSLQSRGMRSYGICLQTEKGQLFLMAEVPSLAELEGAKGPEFMATMAASNLPRGWASAEEIKSSGAIEKLMIFLRKTEVDVHVEVPVGDAMCTINSGILLEIFKLGKNRAIRLRMDISDPEGKLPNEGDEIQIRVGVQDRAFSFTTNMLSLGTSLIEGSATINCLNLLVPTVVKLDQNRSAFRIDAPEKIPVEIKWIDSNSSQTPISSEEADSTDELEMVEELENPAFRGQLMDLSFSGVKIIADLTSLTSPVLGDSLVACRLFFPDEQESLTVKGIVRWVNNSLGAKDNPQDAIGLEFLEGDESNRTGLEYIRQYILRKQRMVLAKRIHVAG